MTGKSRSKVLVVVPRSFEKKKGGKQHEAPSTRAPQEIGPCSNSDPSHSGSTFPDTDAARSGDDISQHAATSSSAQEDSGDNALKYIGVDDQISDRSSSSLIDRRITHLEHGTRKIVPMTWEGLRVSRPNDQSLREFSAEHWHIVPLPTFASGEVDNGTAPSILIPWAEEKPSDTLAASRGFQFFSQLPTELRLQVWEAALPDPRVVTVEVFVYRSRATTYISAPPLITSVLYCNASLGSRDNFWKHYQPLHFISAENASGLRTQTGVIPVGTFFNPVHRVLIDVERETLLFDLKTLHQLDLYRNHHFDTTMRLDMSRVRNVALSFGDLNIYNTDTGLKNRLMQVARYIKANCPLLRKLNIVIGGLKRSEAGPRSITRLIDFGLHLEDVVYEQKPRYLGFWLPGISMQLGLCATGRKIASYKQHFQTQIADAPATSGWAKVDLGFSILARQTGFTHPISSTYEQQFEFPFVAPNQPMPCNDVTFYTQQPVSGGSDFKLELLGTFIRCHKDGELMYHLDDFKDTFDEGEGDHRGAATNTSWSEPWWTRRWMGRRGWKGTISSVYDPMDTKPGKKPEKPKKPKILPYGCLGPRRAPGQRNLEITGQPRDHKDEED